MTVVCWRRTFGKSCSWESRAVPVIALSPELSVGGEGACWTGLVASVGGGVVVFCVLFSEGTLLSPELTVGDNGDTVDWTLPPPLE